MDLPAIRHKGCDDTLRRAERLLFLGIASALAYLLLVLSEPEGSAAVKLALFGVELQTTAARIITSAFSWFAGLYAAFEVERVQNLLKIANDDPELVSALRYSPVSTTSPAPLIAYGPPTAAALTLIAASLYGSIGNEHRDVGECLLGAFFLALPYCLMVPAICLFRKTLGAVLEE